ncbi:hypothetical protein AGR4B_Lc60374 [Agrobacterium tumefaciens str. CFBP 5621]|nr:hypothetical protein AGR4B_Lc60374 [Agrobacterium tumefaciens str. CFBP 5621]
MVELPNLLQIFNFQIVNSDTVCAEFLISLRIITVQIVCFRLSKPKRRMSKTFV